MVLTCPLWSYEYGMMCFGQGNVSRSNVLFPGRKLKSYWQFTMFPIPASAMVETCWDEVSFNKGLWVIPMNRTLLEMQYKGEIILFRSLLFGNCLLLQHNHDHPDWCRPWDTNTLTFHSPKEQYSPVHSLKSLRSGVTLWTHRTAGHYTRSLGCEKSNRSSHWSTSSLEKPSVKCHLKNKGERWVLVFLFSLDVS